MSTERLLPGSTLKDIFGNNQPAEIKTILESKRAPQLKKIREKARDELQEARIPGKAVAWYEIRKKGATMEHKRMWAGIYGNSVKEEMFASQIIGLVKVVKREPVTNLPQEEIAKRRIRNFMLDIRADRKEAEELAGRSVSFSKRIQRRVGAREDVSLYGKPRTRKKRISPS